MEPSSAKQSLANNLQSEILQADRVEITFYTDPLCCWSWAMEPQWRRLQYELRNNMVYRYVMGGLLPSWKNFSDPFYSVSRPMQMGPVWLEASVTSGMPVHDKIWVEDPPASSYPACIAVKCAELQSPLSGVKYLRRLREAVMMHGRNIARQDVLTAVAEELATVHPEMLNVTKFVADLTGDAGLEAFRKDLGDVQGRGITRFPTLIVRSNSKKAIMLTGYRPFPALLEAVKQIAPAIQVSSDPFSMDDYTRFWGSLTPREMKEVSLI